MSSFQPKIYIKDQSSDPLYSTVNKRFYANTRVMPILLPVIGVFIFLTQIVIPLVSFKTSDKISRPVTSSVLGYASGFRTFKFAELEQNTLGITSSIDQNIPDFFYITIPKLGIQKAKVETFPKDLSPDDALGHYPGSALPGEVGNVFIYGHSVLPFFYNAKNYKTIFSTLGELEVGDRFVINYNNKDYEYAVESTKSLKPSEVNPLAEIKPKYMNGSTVVLMTCSPPGTKIYRLLVAATLIK